MVAELRILLSSEQESLEAEQAAMLARLRDEIASTSRRRMQALASTVDLVEREVSEIVATNSESVSTRATRMLEIATAEEDLAERLTESADATSRLAAAGEKVSHPRPCGKSSQDVDLFHARPLIGSHFSTATCHSFGRIVVARRVSSTWRPARSALERRLASPWSRHCL